MALIELHAPSAAQTDTTQDTYLDLTTGISGHKPPAVDMPDNSSWKKRAQKLPGYKHNAILATGVGSVKLRIEKPPRHMSFDDITHATAAQLAAQNNSFTTKKINRLSDFNAGDCMVIETGPKSSPRYFKAYVRRTSHHLQGNQPAFLTHETTLEFEELVKGRLIWTLDVNLGRNTLTVQNLPTEKKVLRKYHKQLMFTLSPESWGHAEGPMRDRVPFTAASVFYNNPFPIARVVFFERFAGRFHRVVEPTWVEHVEVASNFSRSYVNSTYVIHLNKAGRPEAGFPPEILKFSVFLVDRTFSIEEWDPTVVVEPQ